MSGWARQEPLVFSGGDCGGDIQTGESFTARWVADLGDGTFGLVTRSFYTAHAQQDEGDAVGLNGTYEPYLECQTEYLICTDPSDPGGTAEWSEYGYHDAGGEVSDNGAYQAALHAEPPSHMELVRFAPDLAEVA